MLSDKCLEICERLFKKETNRYTAEALHLKACCYLLFDNKERKALSCFLQVLEMREQLFGHDHPGVSANKPNIFIIYALDEIVNCYEKLGEMESFSKYRSKSLAIKRDLFKIKHPDRTYYDIFLIRSKYSGRPAWHYVLVENESKYVELKKRKPGTNIDVTDYGKIIESGWGPNPSKAKIEHINRLYGYEDD